MKPIKVKVGEKYGKLTVLDISNGFCKVICKCDCGSIKEYRSNNLKSGNTRSCGCIGSKGNTKHGDRYTRLYGIWRGIKERCNTPSCSTYKNYGGRGIKVCDEWLDYLSFKNWALENGYKENLTIDRIDVNGDYEPSNCRWVDYFVQANNTRWNHFLTYNNETLTITQWSRKQKISVSTIYRRLNKGLDICEVLAPIKKER